MKRIIKIYYKLLLKQSLQVIFILSSSFTILLQILRERSQTIKKQISTVRKENIFADELKADRTATSDLGEVQCSPSGTVNWNSWVTPLQNCTSQGIFAYLQQQRSLHCDRKGDVSWWWHSYFIIASVLFLTGLEQVRMLPLELLLHRYYIHIAWSTTGFSSTQRSKTPRLCS